MTTEITKLNPRQVARAGFEMLPVAIIGAGEQASWRFIEFFTANIRNRNTRAAYAQAVTQFFKWCDARQLVELEKIQPVVVSAYIEELQTIRSAPTVKQHLAAIKIAFRLARHRSGSSVKSGKLGARPEICNEAR